MVLMNEARIRHLPNRNIICPAYFSQAKYNIITIDYHPIATSLKCYDVAVQNVPIIAKCLTQLLVAILDEYDQFSYVHLIGFSLGSQVAGLVGELFKKKGKTLNRITGKQKSFQS